MWLPVNFFKNLIRTFGPPRISDPIFGEMLWFPGKTPRSGYWEGTARLQADVSDSLIEVFLDGNESGVSEIQRTVFREIPSQLSALREAVAERARTRIEISPLPTAGLRNRWIALPVDPLTQEWELGFDIQGRPNLHLVATVLDWRVKDVSVED